MTCLLNEEIRCIQNTMSQLKRWISIEGDSGKKELYKKRYDELKVILTSKLDEFIKWRFQRIKDGYWFV